MSYCCSETYNLGCFNHCATLSFGEATVTANLTVVMTFAGITSAVTISTVIGDPYEIPLGGLNETATYTMKLYNSDGSEHTVTIGATEYDCFKFKTEVRYNAEVVEYSDDVCCEPVLIVVSGQESYMLTLTQWAKFGSIPNIQVAIKIDGSYQNIAFEQVYDSMPNPSTITITLPGTPPDTWYIILS